MDMRVCAREIMLSITIFLLFTIEIIQLISMGPYTSSGFLSFTSLWRYLNFENIIELVVIILAATCLCTQHKEQYIKWCSAFGIVFAYLGNDKFVIDIEILIFN